MTDIHAAAGGDSPTARVRIGSPAGILAAIPHLLGFYPSASVVVLGIARHTGRVRLTCRYDLPDPPDRQRSAHLAAHVVATLRRERHVTAVVAGYGPGGQVTPVTDALRSALSQAGIAIRDVLRVQDGRYWSYLCQDPRCCPADGTAFDPAAHPAGMALRAAGLAAQPDRAALALTLARLPGSVGEMDEASGRALGRARTMIDAALDQAGEASGGPGRVAGDHAAARTGAGAAGAPGAARLADVTGSDDPDPLGLVVRSGRRAVKSAIDVYRRGGAITDPDQLAWLGMTLTDLRVRDDAWARMDPAYRAAHQRLWTDLVRRLPAAYAAAPAALLAFTAWQSGNGALAGIAVDRALEADPEYSMARLIGRALDAAIPPSAAWPPLTPRQVAASYRRRAASRAAKRGRDQPRAVRQGDPQQPGPRRQDQDRDDPARPAPRHDHD